MSLTHRSSARRRQTSTSCSPTTSAHSRRYSISMLLYVFSRYQRAAPSTTECAVQRNGRPVVLSAPTAAVSLPMRVTPGQLSSNVSDECSVPQHPRTGRPPSRSAETTRACCGQRWGDCLSYLTFISHSIRPVIWRLILPRRSTECGSQLPPRRHRSSTSVGPVLLRRFSQ